MRVNFVLPFLNWTGGIGVALEYAERMARRGHDVAIYVPILPYWFADRPTSLGGLRRWLGDLRLNLRQAGAPSNVNLKANRSVPVHAVPIIRPSYLRPADAVVATAWPTAYSVAGLPDSHGVRYYLVQHHETWSGPADRVDASYFLPLHRIVIATWLERLMIESFGVPVLDVITNGVDLQTFYPGPGNASTPPRVLLQYSPLEWKGFADALDAWRQVRAQCPAARLVTFGLRRGPDVPGEAEFHENPSPTALRRLYNEAQVFVSPSWIEGCQLPPMEAMACRTAVVATNVGGIPDYAVAGKTALVVEPRDVAGLASAILRLLQNGALRERIAEAGYRRIQQFTWDRAVDRFEAALERGRSFPYPVQPID